MIAEETQVAPRDARTRAMFFEELYERAFPAVGGFVSKRGGSFEDARDIFQDALVIFYEKTIAGDLDSLLSREAYLMGIAKHLWIRKYTDERKKVAFDASELSLTIPVEYTEPSGDRLLALLERTGQRCLELLRAFYYDKLSLEDISQRFDFSGTRSATSQKFKCIEKIRATIKEKEIRYEDLSE